MNINYQFLIPSTQQCVYDIKRLNCNMKVNCINSIPHSSHSTMCLQY